MNKSNKIRKNSMFFNPAINRSLFKRISISFFSMFFILISINLISAEITAIRNGDTFYPGDEIKLRIRPTNAGFFNIIYIYQDTTLVDFINVPCSTVCTLKQDISYIVPQNFFGEYYFATFDYAIDDYELDFFTVIEPGGASQGTLQITEVMNSFSGVNLILSPEQGKNANLTISVEINSPFCDTFSVNSYICNSSVAQCSFDSYTYEIPIQFQSRQGRVCTFSYVGEDFFPFYQEADNWAVYSRSGVLEDWENFTYVSLIAVNYTPVIDFGTLNSNVWNIAVPENGIDLINIGNLPFLVEWASNGFACTSQNCTDFWQPTFQGEERFQIDDDEFFLEETETGLTPEFVTNHSLNFFPQNEISVCISKDCNNGVGERVKTYFNLKIPTIERGNYQGDIEITLY